MIRVCKNLDKDISPVTLVKFHVALNTKWRSYSSFLRSTIFLRTITFSKLKSLNSWDNRSSVPEAEIRGREMQ